MTLLHCHRCCAVRARAAARRPTRGSRTISPSDAFLPPTNGTSETPRSENQRMYFVDEATAVTPSVRNQLININRCDSAYDRLRALRLMQRMECRMDAFVDRVEAGRLLAHRVAALKLADPVVLALPRGGVPVAAAVGRALHAPLALPMVRKIGPPQQAGLAAAGAVDGDRPAVVRDPAAGRLSGAHRHR